MIKVNTENWRNSKFMNVLLVCDDTFSNYFNPALRVMSDVIYRNL